MSDRPALWARWKRLAHRAAQVQSHVLLFILYVVAVVPVGAARRLWTDPLGTRSGVPSWRPRPTDPDAATAARRQF
jgi:hypothetical protein